MYRYLIFFLIAGAFSCSAPAPAEAPAAPPSDAEAVTLSDNQLRNAGIRTGTAENRLMQNSVTVNGVVDVPPENRISVSFPMGGSLRTIHLLPGMRIRRGQVLAVLEDQAFVQLQEDYLMAGVRLTLQQKEYERQKGLNESKTTSDKVFEQATAEVEGTRVMVRSLAEKLRLIGLDPARVQQNSISRSVRITSSINGYVTAVNVNAGQYITPGEVLFELVNPDDLHVALTVFEKDVARIHRGQAVVFRPVSDSAAAYNGKVMLTGRVVDSNRSMMVHCHFQDPAPSLVPGVFVQAQIMIQQESMLAIPEEAVVRSGNKEYIFIEQKPHLFRMRPVETGTRQGGWVAIQGAGNALAGQRLITVNAYAALMKLKNVAEEE